MTSSGRAFTTIEILIVVVIMGITAAIAIPMVSNRSDLRLAAATRKVTADLQYAQNCAIATRDPVYVRVAANSYSLCKKVGGTFTVITHPVDMMAFTVKFGSSPSSSSLAGVTMPAPSLSGNGMIGFDTLGVPFLYNETTSLKTSMAASSTITLNCGTRSQAIIVEPYTGEISAP